MFCASRASVSPDSVASRPIRDSSCCVAPTARGLTLRVPPRSVRAIVHGPSHGCARRLAVLSRSAARLSDKVEDRAECRGVRLRRLRERRSGRGGGVPRRARGACSSAAAPSIPGKGLWDLPGGFLHEDEHPLDGLRREVREETALEIEPIELPRASGSSRTTDGSCSASPWTALASRRCLAPATTSSSCAGSSRTVFRGRRSSRSRTIPEVLSAALGAGTRALVTRAGSILNFDRGPTRRRARSSIAASSLRARPASTTKRSPLRSDGSASGR